MKEKNAAGARWSSLLRYHDLAPYRIREVLLVSSDYDAFVIEEDGMLGERLFVNYSEFYLVTAPRIIHASTAAEALEILARRRIDLVLTTLSDGEDWVPSFVRRVIGLYKQIPVAILVLDEVELKRLKVNLLPKELAGLFLWTGDNRLIPTILNIIEDRLNVAYDTKSVGVQVIISVEDSISAYSLFLTHLYDELMVQSRSLVAEGVNLTHRFLRMLTRPKILLATSYEEALQLFRKYRKNVLALISDVQFSRAGVSDPQAGLLLAQACMQEKPHLPVLLQSVEHGNRASAESLGIHFAEKNAETLRPALRLFLEESLGFGSFVFRLPDRSEVARARDAFELERVLQTVDLRSIHYHAYNNHFNVWLRARSIFAIADEVEAVQASSFGSDEAIRDYLLNVVHRSILQDQEGTISDFSGNQVASEYHLVKIGKGSIGGKGRGIAFMHSRLGHYFPGSQVAGMKLVVPRTVILASDCFDRFLAFNGLQDVASQGLSDEELLARFLASELPPSIVKDLKPATLDLHGPLIVRSSSLLEDSQHQSCAGIYCTRLVSNDEASPEERFSSLCQAVFRVYMSTFSTRARTYLGNTVFSVEEEKMAVVIQEVVGRRRGDLFYPFCSGVALSYNYYPSGPQKPEDGVVMLSFGLGHMVAEGGRSVRFSPRWPQVLPHLNNVQSFLQFSQKHFYAVSVRDGASTGEPEVGHSSSASIPSVNRLGTGGRFASGEGMEAAKLGESVALRAKRDTVSAANRKELDERVGIVNDDGVTLFPLSRAERDGTLAMAASVYSWDDAQWREGLSYAGPRAITFNNVLKWGALPLPEVLDSLLKRFSVAMGGAVEIEFAVDIGASESEGESEPKLSLLQIRPLASCAADIAVYLSRVVAGDVLCCSALAHGSFVAENVCDIVYVRVNMLDAKSAKCVARTVGEIGARLGRRRPYVLVGPGRWGSADPFLGIPVTTAQILGAKVIVELPYGDKDVEPSQGSHFFHELTVLEIGYMTLMQGWEQPFSGGAQVVSEEALPDSGFFDKAWCDAQEAETETDLVRHVHLAQPLHVLFDGKRRRAIILKRVQSGGLADADSEGEV